MVMITWIHNCVGTHAPLVELQNSASKYPRLDPTELATTLMEVLMDRSLGPNQTLDNFGGTAMATTPAKEDKLCPTKTTPQAPIPVKRSARHFKPTATSNIELAIIVVKRNPFLSKNHI